MSGVKNEHCICRWHDELQGCRELKRKVQFFVVPWHCMFGLTRHVVAFRRSLGRRPVTLCRICADQLSALTEHHSADAPGFSSMLLQNPL